MRRLLTRSMMLLLPMAFAIASGCTTSSEPDKPRVLVFGIDGGTWRVIEPMMEAGELPNLKRLYDAGVRGVLETRPPALSPVVWSTIFTGRLPNDHGVVNWKTSHSTHRKVKAVWEITSDAEMATHVINVPSTWPPTPVAGTMVSGFPLSGSTFAGNTGQVLTLSGLSAAKLALCYKNDVELIREHMEKTRVGGWSPYFAVKLRNRPDWRGYTRVKRLGDDSFYIAPCYRDDEKLVVTMPAAMRQRLSDALGEPFIPEGPGWSKWAEPETPDYLYEHLVQVSRGQTLAASMLAKTPWRLLVYVDTLVDRVSHPYWAYAYPDGYEDLPAEKAERYKDIVGNAYRETDRQLGNVLDAASGEFYVVMASDHGFKSSRDPTKQIGTHDMDGIYLVAGPGLGATAGDRTYIENIGPTILYLLGMPLARDMVGKVIPEVASQIGRQVEYVASYEDGVERGSDLPVDDKTWDQLKGLGYVDGDPPRQKQGEK